MITWVKPFGVSSKSHRSYFLGERDWWSEWVRYGEQDTIKYSTLTCAGSYTLINCSRQGNSHNVVTLLNLFTHLEGIQITGTQVHDH